MTVKIISRVVDGRTAMTAEKSRKTGMYHCHHPGENTNSVMFASLDEVAEFLAANPKSGVRMNPGWSNISKNIYVDGSSL